MIVSTTGIFLIITLSAAAALPFENKLYSIYGWTKTNSLIVTNVDDLSFNTDVSTNGSSNMRIIKLSKRDEFSDRADECTALRIASITAEGSANIASAAAGVASSLGFVGAGPAAAAGVIATVGFTTQMSSDLAWEMKGCGNVAFDELKDILGKKFEKTDQAIDRNYETLKAVESLVGETLSIVEKTRYEMHQGFNNVLNIMKNSEVEKTIEGINKFSKYFVNEKYIIGQLSTDKRIAKLEEPGYIEYLKDSRTPKSDSLFKHLTDIINRKFTVSKDGSNDQIAVSALFALYYGCQTLISVMFFLLDQNSFLTDYYYNENDIDNFNKYLGYTQTTFSDFKSTLVGNGGKSGLIDDILKVFEVDNNGWKKSEQEKEKINLLKKIKEQIQKMKLQLISDVPEKLVGKPNFRKSKVNTPIGAWVDGERVSYAIQFKDKGMYSKVGAWSDSVTIRGKANPSLKIPVDRQKRNRLVFRILNSKPKLVGVMTKPSETEFKDIDRDLYSAASRSDEDSAIEDIEVWIKNGASTKAKFESGRSAIHSAARGGNVNVAEQFLINDNPTSIDAKDDLGFTPFHISAEAGQDEFIELLIEKNADINAKTNVKQFTPMHIAAYNGYGSTVETLLTNDKTNINAKDSEGFTSLHKSIYGGIDVLNTIIEDSRTDINAKSKEGLTVLHLSIIEAFDDIVEELLNNDKVEVNARADGNLTALHFAIISNNLDIVDILLSSSKTDINALAVDNMTPLHYAVSLKNVDIAKKLINSDNIKVDIFTTGVKRVTPLLIAAASGQTSIVEELINKKTDINAATEYGLTALHLAARNAYLDTVKVLVESGANLEAKDKDSNTPLIIALKSGNNEVVKYLTDKGANIKDVRDAVKNTALIIAVKNNTLEMAKYTIVKGCDINAKDEDSNSPLLIAVKSKSLRIVSYLIDKKANIEDKDKKGDTSLYISLMNGYEDTVKLLASRKANVNDKYKDSNTPLHLAVKKGSLSSVKILVLKGADIKAKDGDDKTPLQVAQKIGNKDIIKYLTLIEQVADSSEKEATDKAFETAKSGNEDLLEYLLNIKGVDPFKLDDKRKTFLIIVAENGHLGIVKLLMETTNIDVNSSDLYLRTALHYAAMNNFIDIVEYLVDDAVANTELKDNNGKTALQLARDKNNVEIVDFLQYR